MLRTKVGSFTAKTSTGSQSTTGIGFQPKIVFFFSHGATTTGTATNAPFMLGVATSSSDERSAFRVSGDNAGTSDVDGWNQNDCSLIIAGITGSVQIRADFTSMDADGFTLNYSTATGSAHIINYLALGGDTLTNVKTGQITEKLTTGSQSTTGVGFQPDALIMFAGYSTTSAPSSNAAGSNFTIGFASGANNQGVMAERGQDIAPGGSNTARYQSASNIFAFVHDSTDTVPSLASLTSFDSDGFTLNWSAVSGSAQYVFYVALKGGEYKVGSFNQATSTGNQSVATSGVLPRAVWLQSFNNITTSSVVTSDRQSMGVAASSSDRFTLWYGDQDGQNPSQADSSLDQTKIIKMMTSGAGSPSTEASADLVSLNSNSFVINWSAADATAREILYFAMGDLPQGGAFLLNMIA